jgi:hypothetical protein
VPALELGEAEPRAFLIRPIGWYDKRFPTCHRYIHLHIKRGGHARSPGVRSNATKPANPTGWIPD